MEQRLDAAARAGDIDTLYFLMREDRHLLRRIEEEPFVDTPLHVAAYEGQVYFSMEIMRLKPSFARKLNQDGYSPIHLALQNNQTKLALRLLDFDRDLVRVQGREGKTPLHFAVEFGMIDLLAEFLSACPKSILDTTIRKDSSLHVAVKSDQLEALKVLVGWLDHVGKDEVLNWCDDEGNTILHVAASRNRIEMASLVIDRIDINAKTLANLTALDISSDGSKLRLMLLRGGALKASSLPTVPKLADSLKSKMSWREKWIVSDHRQRLYLSKEDRKIILLAAVLFATANYQAALDSIIGVGIIFKLINNIAFLASMVEIFFHLPADCGILRLVLPLVVWNYAVVDFAEWSFTLMLFILALMFLFYYSKWAVVLHKCVPMLVQKKVVKMKVGIFRHCSGFHKEFVA